MDSMDLWKPKITRRPHPGGAAGIRRSLDEVARRVKEGFDHPDVRSWAGQKLWEAGDPKGHLNQATALLKAVRAQSVYANDPDGVEYMVGAHVTLGDGKSPPKMRAADCDDFVIAYLSACESVGIRTAVCGAAYDEGGNIAHVLGMVFADDNWYYTDPSVDFPFGEAKKATFEDVIDVRTGQHICASNACSIPLSGKKPPEIGAGRFVGVDGLPGMLNGLPGGTLGEDISTTPTTADIDSLRALSARLGQAWDTFVDVYTDMQEVSTILGAPQPGDAANLVWTPEVEQRARNAHSQVAILRLALDQAAAGARKVGYIKYENGLVDVGIERLPGDPYYVALDQNMVPHVFQTSDNAPVNSSGQIAGFPVLAAIGGALANPAVLIVGGVIAGVVTVTYLITSMKQAMVAAEQQKNAQDYDLIKGGNATPDQLTKRDEAQAKIAEMKAKADPPLGKQLAETAEAAGSLLTTIVGGAIVLGIGYVAFTEYQKRRG